MTIQLSSTRKGYFERPSIKRLFLFFLALLIISNIGNTLSGLLLLLSYSWDGNAVIDHPAYLADPVKETNQLGKAKATRNVKTTKIVGFSDHGYKELAWKWYQELEKLGYKEHEVAAQDRVASEYFREKGMRYDLVHPSSNSSLREECGEYYSQFKPGKRSQTYRRSLFGSRWNYVLRQLRDGYHVLMTDVDNVFVRHVPLTELETSEFDAYHAYAGTHPSFPLTIYQAVGFTICGGLSWLRSTPGVIKFVEAIVNRCKCEKMQCACHCDDQVVMNDLISMGDRFKIKWDSPVHVPASEAEISWEGMTGTCNSTGHRVKIWDRHTAFRSKIDPNVCPDDRNWIAMPSVLDRTTVWETWREVCGSTSLDASGNVSILRQQP
jgi:hypothetical protein